MANKIHFITYGDSKNINSKHIVGLARYSNFFDSCNSFSKKDLDYDFVNKYKEILNQKRGGGFYLGNQELFLIFKKINDNDILVYTDSGSFNYLAKKGFLNILKCYKCLNLEI